MIDDRMGDSSLEELRTRKNEKNGLDSNMIWDIKFNIVIVMMRKWWYIKAGLTPSTSKTGKSQIRLLTKLKSPETESLTLVPDALVY